jgi:hypothetical protein
MNSRILYRVFLDSRHSEVSKTKHTTHGKVVSRPFRLDIAYLGDGYYLLHYDIDGNELTDTCHDTEDEAFRQAEYEYGIKKTDWVKQ